jgi:hypothetical protein
MNKFVGKGRMVRNTVVNGFSNKALSFIVAGQRISPTHVCECITEGLCQDNCVNCIWGISLGDWSEPLLLDRLG